eukprot:scaffold10630_cov16-Tisochrysis_lutea.AAC.3
MNPSLILMFNPDEGWTGLVAGTFFATAQLPPQAEDSKTHHPVPAAKDVFRLASKFKLTEQPSYSLKGMKERERWFVMGCKQVLEHSPKERHMQFTAEAKAVSSAGEVVLSGWSTLLDYEDYTQPPISTP